MVVYERFQLKSFNWDKLGVLDRWSLTKGSNLWILTGINWVFWIGGRSREVPTKRVLSGINLVFRWSLTRGSYYRVLGGNNLVF